MTLLNLQTPIFVTGIDTNIGKTVISAILVKLFHANYWKPIQCGDLDDSDTQMLQSLTKLPKSHFFKEQFSLSLPASPHLAAKKQGIDIKLDNFILPNSKRPLIVEGAGGILVPLNEKEYLIDLAIKFKMSVIIVTKNYLGSLNHTFLTVEFLRNKHIPIAGIIFNGQRNPELEDFVSKKYNLKILFNVNEEEIINSNTIFKYVQGLQKCFTKTTSGTLSLKKKQLQNL
jgi:dethiobiotin synthetase